MPRVYVGDMEFGRCPYAGVEIDELIPGQLWVKVGGIWKRVRHAHLKRGGAWEPVKLYVKNYGEWRNLV